MTYKALMDAITKLGHLLERPDLTMDKRHKYQAELLKLTQARGVTFSNRSDEGYI